MHRKPADPQLQVDAEIGHVKGLVLVRRVLAEHGASPAELRECDAVIAESRRQLAELSIRAFASAA